MKKYILPSLKLTLVFIDFMFSAYIHCLLLLLAKLAPGKGKGETVDGKWKSGWLYK